MNFNKFFRKGILALLVAATALVACSKDSDDNYELKYGTITINGVERKIIAARYGIEDEENEDYNLYLALAKEEGIMLSLNKKLHMNGSNIRLYQEETAHGGYYWGVTYTISQDNNNWDKEIFSASGNPNLNKLFSQGTLTVSGSPKKGITISLKDGKVKGIDKENDQEKEYSLSINFNGAMRLIYK